MKFKQIVRKHSDMHDVRKHSDMHAGMLSLKVVTVQLLKNPPSGLTVHKELIMEKGGKDTLRS